MSWWTWITHLIGVWFVAALVFGLVWAGIGWRINSRNEDSEHDGERT